MKTNKNVDWSEVGPELLEAAKEIRSRHDAEAKRVNFDDCGCPDCVALRPAISRASGEK